MTDNPVRTIEEEIRHIRAYLMTHPLLPDHSRNWLKQNRETRSHVGGNRLKLDDAQTYDIEVGDAEDIAQLVVYGGKILLDVRRDHPLVYLMRHYTPKFAQEVGR